ncbi:TPA: TIGR00730 family Rossman fold protein [Serratia rubidaea]|nr:TIGR00730 family Rossman fold protein [Serratia rubidaea]HDJ1439207.1 TIGR00730 family Rossman fold protein [Serratia rubidaea]HDJ1449744.1 TIGR00730 family Rossman fold protein [Serratia rubidaea]HDJ1462275.1 TIGR00730 family Rossman fold protein [Serratia rubidaea]
MNVCVFCSSGDGINPLMGETAFQAGSRLARRGDTIIHGGSRGGLMGKLTLGAVAEGGQVIGVTCPQVRASEPTPEGDMQIIEAGSLGLRKTIMIENADEFLILPGGFGTLDETCEVITQKQLGLISQSVSFINIDGYWDNFFEFIMTAEREKMIITAGRDTFRKYRSLDEYFS